jgi:outer membrane protein
MFLRFAAKPMLVGLAFFVLCQAAPAQTQAAPGPAKVAVINLQRAVFESAEIKKANEEMQATFKPRQDKIEQLQKEIAALSQQLQQGASKLTPQAEADLQVQGQRKQRDLQRLQDDLQQDAQSYRNDILSKSSEKMTEIVKKLAEEKALDLVVDTSSALYFKPALDITADAIAAYDKAYPPKK